MSRPRALQLISIILGIAILAIIGYLSVRTDDPHNSLFGTYWASGRAVLHGQNPYALYPQTYRSDLSWCGGPGSAPDLNLNPPITLPLFGALARLPVETFSRAWTAASVLCFACGVLLLYWQIPDMHPYQILWLLAMTPAINTVSAGQIYGVLFLLASLACVLGLRVKLLLSGVALGLLMAIKPTMAFFVPFLWIAGYGAAALSAATVVAGLYVFALVIDPHSYLQWMAALHGDGHWIVPTDIAPIAVARRHGMEWLGIVVAVAIFVALALFIWKRRPSFIDTCGLAACAGLLCAPLAWHNYLVVAAPFFAARQWRRSETVAAALLIIPTSQAILAGSAVYVAVAVAMAASFSQIRISSVADPQHRTSIPA